MIRPGWRTSGSTALFTFLNFNGENTLETLRPKRTMGHRIGLRFRVLWFFDRFLRNNVFTQIAVRREHAMTLGIVAFSEAQQEEINDALQRLARDDVDFASHLEEELERSDDEQFVGLLVKNLENIQGDERDIIILSVCSGFAPNGKIRMNFGPINRSGGEKRLNVAFSRAKQNMCVVSSITGVNITNDYHEGAYCLKQYLNYAEAASIGNAEAAARILGSLDPRQGSDAEDRASPEILVDQVAAALIAKDYVVDTDIGQSHFRCDLAVRKQGDDAFRLGILIDGAGFYQQSDLLEREMLRPRLLRNFGWTITHVLASHWYSDRAGCLQRIESLIEGEPEELPSEDSLDEEISEAIVPAGESIQTADSASEENEVCYLEVRSDRSAKFWEITRSGSSHTVRFGRIETKGQSRTKVFDDAEAAKRDLGRLVREKIAKGYVRTEPG